MPSSLTRLENREELTIAMKRIRKTLLGSLLWLTAAMTLVAGIPHFICRCPNGQTKPFCLGLSSEETPCCCEGACCASSTKEDQGSECSCCKAKATRQRAGPESSCGKDTALGRLSQDVHVSDSGCSRTLAQPEDRTPPTQGKSLTTDIPAGASLASPVAVDASAPATPHARQLLWEGHHLPPVDLLIALQHFII